MYNVLRNTQRAGSKPHSSPAHFFNPPLTESLEQAMQTKDCRLGTKCRLSISNNTEATQANYGYAVSSRFLFPLTFLLTGKR